MGFHPASQVIGTSDALWTSRPPWNLRVANRRTDPRLDDLMVHPEGAMVKNLGLVAVLLLSPILGVMGAVALLLFLAARLAFIAFREGLDGG